MKEKIIIASALFALALTSCTKSTNTITTSSETSTSTIETPTTTSTSEEKTTSKTKEKETCIISVYDAETKELLGKVLYEEGDKLGDAVSKISRVGYNLGSIKQTATSSKDLAYDTILAKVVDFTVYTTWTRVGLNLGKILNYNPETTTLNGLDYYNTGSVLQQLNFNDQGYASGYISDFSQYENTSSYVKVSNAKEFFDALTRAKTSYTSTWEYEGLTSDEEKNVEEYNKLMEERANSSTGKSSNETRRIELENIVNTYSGKVVQTLNKKGTVNVIEITDDINLGYNQLSSEEKSYTSIVSDWYKSNKTYSDTLLNGFTETSHIKENGISQISISNTNTLLVYSKNGCKLTNAGFKVTSCDDVVFRNLDMDGIWQWEDSPSATPIGKIGDMDAQGWAYFKISFSAHVWIDHCSFGKSYDGQIDISNPYWFTVRTASYAPFGTNPYKTEGYTGIHISNCNFHAGSKDKDGYLYKMMEEIEEDYQKSLSDSTYQTKYLYYKTLRDGFTYGSTNVSPLTFDEVLEAIAIPQKKAFLNGDSSDEYWYNTKLKVSYGNCYFKNIEDRLPNVRGGMAYMYNCVIDAREYQVAKDKVKAKGLTNSAIKAYNSNYKCGLVSQGIVVGYGASVAVENTIFLGVAEIVKNNNGSNADELIKKVNPSTNENYTIDDLDGSYMFTNVLSIYSDFNDDLDVTSKIMTYSTKTIPSVEGSADASTEKFNWHNINNTKPFNPNLYVNDNNYLNGLMSALFSNLSIGANSNFGNLYLNTSSIK